MAGAHAIVIPLVHGDEKDERARGLASRARRPAIRDIVLSDTARASITSNHNQRSHRMDGDRLEWFTIVIENFSIAARKHGPFWWRPVVSNESVNG